MNASESRPVRYVAKCRRCNVVTTTLASRVGYADANMGALMIDAAGESGTFGAITIRCRGCGVPRAARPVRAIVRREIACNAKCHASTGHQCECSCGGKNHGSSHAA